MSDGTPTDPRATARGILETERTCTLATASADAVPEAATVRFVATDKLNIYITTERPYQKYANLTENPRVAVVVDGEYNLQLEGTATELVGEDAAIVAREYTDKYGPSEYLNNDESVFFEITTHWARLLVDTEFPPSYEVVLGDGRADPHDAG
ncbi:pyridoxamine 5'-phosphate oxidase family protein [Halobaculum sp. MBLA0147]|uniref:pyridoxamine 5'-phosphate oxidase family protein n=1 Tax=Halobaculum sp. MBLA0147 TaxID=3079934 RepID=UPI003524E949